jgi:hypothetical protein
MTHQVRKHRNMNSQKETSLEIIRCGKLESKSQFFRLLRGGEKDRREAHKPRETDFFGMMHFYGYPKVPHLVV